MDERIKKIAIHYGLIPQMKKTQEELKELDEAITLFLDGEKNTLDHVIEELVDVKIMLLQIETLLHVDEAICEYAKYKLNRQIERIRMEEDVQGEIHSSD